MGNIDAEEAIRRLKLSCTVITVTAVFYYVVMTAWIIYAKYEAGSVAELIADLSFGSLLILSDGLIGPLVVVFTNPVFVPITAVLVWAFYKATFRASSVATRCVSLTLLTIVWIFFGQWSSVAPRIL